MLEKTGIASKEQVMGIYPDQKRREEGAFAAIECFQNIPCNPCFSSCPKSAIRPMEDINDLPKVDFDKCNGCGICQSNCPGLAIFIIDESFSDAEAIVRIPYEFLPLPNKGDTVIATDREGKRVCDAIVQNVVNTKAQGRTASVSLKIPKEFSMDVRCFKPLKDNADICADKQHNEQTKKCNCIKPDNITDQTKGDTYLCRCEEVTVAQIREYIAKGYTTLDEIKRVSRAGMGACQGRTCRRLIMDELSKATGQKQEDMPVTTFRPPVKPIKMSLLIKEDTEE